MTEVSNIKSYTETKATAYGDVTGAAPIAVGGRNSLPNERRFRPERITVKYAWRTHVRFEDGWTIDAIEVSGRWIDAEGEPTGTGSGCVLWYWAIADDWAKEFAEANYPTTRLVDRRREPIGVPVQIPPDGIKDGQWRLAVLLDEEQR